MTAFNQQNLDWPMVVSQFHVMSANDLVQMQTMERYQRINAKVQWLTEEQVPLALFFISHRWETLAHPDPQGEQMRALQQFLHSIVRCIEAMLVDRNERVELIPSLHMEGILQAEEIVRRILGFGPFSNRGLCLDGKTARQHIQACFSELQDDRPAFRRWILRNVGVWLDYVCMPQKPLAPGEDREFRRTLSALDSLVRSSTLVALRKSDDDYAMRGWCASEFFLGSAHSFSRAIYIDMVRLGQPVFIGERATPTKGNASGIASIMTESYDQDRQAFQDECEQWTVFDRALVQIIPPAPWAAYRDLQGSTFYTAKLDPNPARRALEMIRAMETALIKHWLLSHASRTFDLGMEVQRFLNQFELRCAERTDLVYLGFVLAGNSRIEVFQPLFREGLAQYLDTPSDSIQLGEQKTIRPLVVTLHPLTEEVRALFFQVDPASAETWNFRLASERCSHPEEQAVVDEIRVALQQQPPMFTFHDPEEPQLSPCEIETLV